VDESKKVRLTWRGGLKSALLVCCCTLCGKRGWRPEKAIDQTQ
jgi:hypothetical protein